MFSSYKRVLWLALIMSAFWFVPFVLRGWSTDVWTRFMRIYEWANAGFPFKETLMMSQNFPFGHEMHWTRPLDWIGYIFAWPFIPRWGLHEALEIMSFYVPILTFLVGIVGFFYAMKGYLLPKAAFFGFWLFVFGQGYAWGQSVVGYFDHHVFHFTLLVWLLALTARFFLKPKAFSLMVWAGVLTAVGTWITAEFFINLYIVSIPFFIYWLMENKSLKPLLYYTSAYTLTLLAAMSFDHPIAGFWTLDFYRVSLFHVILGGFNLIGIASFMLLFKYMRTTAVRRFIYAILTGLVLLSVLCVCFGHIFIQPMVDPFIRHMWIVHVSEMRPTYNSILVVPWVVFPIVLALGFLVYALFHFRAKQTPFILLLIFGILFYAPMLAFHIRVGISLNAFFMMLGALFFGMVFFPREKKRLYTVLFCLFFMLWIAVILRGDAVLYRAKQWAFDYFYKQYEVNQSVEIPEWFQKDVVKKYEEKQKQLVQITGTAYAHLKKEKDVAADKKEEKASSVELLSDQNPKSCSVSEEAIQLIKQDNQNGSVMTELFMAPEVLWKTKKPVFGGPYHTIVEGHKDLFFAFLNRDNFDDVYQIIQKHQVSQIYLQHPKCTLYLFRHPDTEESYLNLEETFYFAVYNESEKMPDWLELEFYNPNTSEKIFRVIEPSKKAQKQKRSK